MFPDMRNVSGTPKLVVMLAFLFLSRKNSNPKVGSTVRNTVLSPRTSRMWKVNIPPKNGRIALLVSSEKSRLRPGLKLLTLLLLPNWVTRLKPKCNPKANLGLTQVRMSKDTVGLRLESLFSNLVRMSGDKRRVPPIPKAWGFLAAAGGVPSNSSMSNVNSPFRTVLCILCSFLYLLN